MSDNDGKLVSNEHLPISTNSTSKETGISKTRGCKTSTSNFLITLNTNVRVTSTEAEEYGPVLYELSDTLFTNDENLKNQLKHLNGKSVEEGWEDVESYCVAARVEVGHNKMGSRMHLHVSVKVRHHGKIHIDVERLYFDCETFLTSKKFPFPIKNIHVSAHKADVKDYIENK